MPNPGYVYILFNSAMPHLVKVGQTTRDPSQRAREIGGTGVPVDFAVAYEERVQDCVEVERQVHRALAPYRYNPKREFFRLPLKDAIETVRQVAEAERVRRRQEDAIETALRLEADRARLQQRPEPTQRHASTDATRARAWLPAADDPPHSSTASPPPRDTRVTHPPRLRWRVLSGLLRALSICTGLLTVPVVVVCCQGLSRSRSAGDACVGIVASIVMLAPCLAITWFGWKAAARALRSRPP